MKIQETKNEHHFFKGYLSTGVVVQEVGDIVDFVMDDDPAVVLGERKDGRY